MNHNNEKELIIEALKLKEDLGMKLNPSARWQNQVSPLRHSANESIIAIQQKAKALKDITNPREIHVKETIEILIGSPRTPLKKSPKPNLWRRSSLIYPVEVTKSGPTPTSTIRPPLSTPEIGQAIFCAGCGSRMSSSVSFCGKCGKRIN